MVEALLQRTVGGGRDEVTHSPLPRWPIASRDISLIGQGAKTADIARRLHLSVKTIETYRDRIRTKLDLSDGTALAHYATKWTQENGWTMFHSSDYYHTQVGFPKVVRKEQGSPLTSGFI